MDVSLDEVSGVIRLVREVYDLWDDPRQWRQCLLEGACRLLNGHVGLMLADYQPERGWFGSLALTSVVGVPESMRPMVQPAIAQMDQRQFEDVSENFLPGVMTLYADMERQGWVTAAGSYPIQMLNVFAQDVKACLGQWPLEGDKSTEPEVLKAHLSELFERYPALRLITGDALYAQRNLAELILASGHDYLFQLKGNQPDAHDAAQSCFAQANEARADVKTVDKKGVNKRLVFYGSTWTTPIMSESVWVLPVVACSCESTAAPRTAAAKRRAKRGTSSRASIRLRSSQRSC